MIYDRCSDGLAFVGVLQDAAKGRFIDALHSYILIEKVSCSAKRGSHGSIKSAQHLRLASMHLASCHLSPLLFSQQFTFLIFLSFNNGFALSNFGDLIFIKFFNPVYFLLQEIFGSFTRSLLLELA